MTIALDQLATVYSWTDGVHDFTTVAASAVPCRLFHRPNRSVPGALNWDQLEPERNLHYAPTVTLPHPCQLAINDGTGLARWDVVPGTDGVIRPFTTIIQKRATVVRSAFPQRIGFQVRVDSPDSYGQPIPAWFDLETYEDLPCRVVTAGFGDETEATLRRLDQYGQLSDLKRIVLPRALPALTTEHRAILDGVPYGIRVVQVAETVQLTRLVLERVTVGVAA